MKTVFMLLFFAISYYAPADEPVVFNDAGLKAAVETELGITDPNSSDMLKLTQLTANSENITDLTGLGFAQNLLYLNLSSNYIADVNELDTLKDPNHLRYLFLADNKIANISPLANLKSLKFLSLSANKISDIQDLGDLAGLESLGLDNNQIDTLSGLEKLSKLKSLSLNHNQIHDISPLTSLNELNSLYLTSNFLDTPAYCTHLADIRKNNQGIYISYDANPNLMTNDCSTSFDELSTFILHWLESPFDPNYRADLNYDDTTDMYDFGIFSGLWYRDVVYFPDPNLRSAVETTLGITSPDPNDMALLTSLKTPYSGIANLTGLQYATQLKELYIPANQITDLSALSGLTDLEILELSDNSISDISAVSNLVKLKTLAMQSNQISDITAIAGLTALETLDLSDNQISTPGAIQYLSGLTRLNISFNQISDISPLTQLHNLDILYLSGNPLSTPAYCSASVPGGYLLSIQSNNPGIHLSYDSNPNLLTADCSTSFTDFAAFASDWMNDNCDPSNTWCGDADLDHDSNVTVDDLIIFAGLWLENI